MGKHKRKTCAILASVLLLAVVAVFGANGLIAMFSNSNASGTNQYTWTWSTTGEYAGTSVNCQVSYYVPANNKVYLLRFAGQRSDLDTNTKLYGKGGVVCTFYKADTGRNFEIGFGGGYGPKAYGGGYTKAYSNFALPKGQDSGVAYAGGGGGRCRDIGLAGTPDAVWGGADNVRSSKRYTDKSSSAGNGTHIEAGEGGNRYWQERTSAGSRKDDGYNTPGDGNGTYGGACTSGKSGKWNGYGGGGGYWGGGAGGSYVEDRWGKDQVDDWSDQYNAGGGSCSPNTYWYGSHDSFGYIEYYQLTPDGTLPSGNYTQTYNGSSYTGPGRLSSSASGRIWGWTSDNRYDWRLEYFYSTDNGSTWLTTIPSRTEVGTTTVLYRYVIYSTQLNTTHAAENYNMKTKDEAIADSNYWVCSGTYNIVIEKGTASVATAPTLKSGLTYTGSAQALLNAGTSNNGTLKYYASTTNSKPTNTNNFTSTIPTGTTATTYYIWYYVQSNDTSKYTDGAITSLNSITIGTVDLP